MVRVKSASVIDLVTTRCFGTLLTAPDLRLAFPLDKVNSYRKAAQSKFTSNIEIYITLTGCHRVLESVGSTCFWTAMVALAGSLLMQFL